MSRKYNVVVSKEATEMLISCAEFLARVSESAAERLVCEFENTIGSLEDMPERCPRYTNEFLLHKLYRYVIFEKRYCALFSVESDNVYVDYVIDTREDNTRYFV